MRRTELDSLSLAECPVAQRGRLALLKLVNFLNHTRTVDPGFPDVSAAGSVNTVSELHCEGALSGTEPDPDLVYLTISGITAPLKVPGAGLLYGNTSLMCLIDQQPCNKCDVMKINGVNIYNSLT